MVDFYRKNKLYQQNIQQISEDKKLKKNIFAAATGLFLALTLTACGKDPALSEFKGQMDTFCNTVVDINDSINSIDPEAEGASALALGYLDQLDTAFREFAEIDFPADYDYLEPIADEAGQYMTQAVQGYHLAYAEDGYDEAVAASAREDSARAFKRVQVILDVLQRNVSAGDAQ